MTYQYLTSVYEVSQLREAPDVCEPRAGERFSVSQTAPPAGEGGSPDALSALEKICVLASSLFEIEKTNHSSNGATVLTCVQLEWVVIFHPN